MVVLVENATKSLHFAHFWQGACHAKRHLNLQKWSALVFLTFWLRNVLRATTACTFSTSQLAKVFRSWRFLYILTSTYASRHNGMQFFISNLASWLRTRCFSEPTFRPSGASNHWKNTVFRGFPTFPRICIFFLLTLSLLLFSLLIFSLLSASALLCFSSVHIVGSLTSKLPSIIQCIKIQTMCSTSSKFYPVGMADSWMDIPQPWTWLPIAISSALCR